jgi:hypothetical protein
MKKILILSYNFAPRQTVGVIRPTKLAQALTEAGNKVDVVCVKPFGNLDHSFDKALEKQTEYLTKDKSELEKQIKADLLKQNPQARPQNGGASKTKEEILAIKDTALRQAEIAKNLHLFT